MGRRIFVDTDIINAIPNHWDRDVALKQALGVPPEAFARSAAVLGIR